MKKSVCLLLILALYSFRNYAQTGLEGFNYQSIVRDNQGVPLTNKAINFRFSLLDGSANGNAQYVETKLITTNATGLVNHIVGKGTPVQGTFNAVPFQNANQFLKVEADIAGGNNFQTIGTTQLVSVPYAQYAAKTNGMSVVGLLNISNVTSLLLNNSPISPNEFHSQPYTAGVGELAVVQISTSLAAAGLHTTSITLNIGISENNGPFLTNSSSSAEIVLPITGSNGGVLSNSAVFPLTAGKTYIFSPVFNIGLLSINYFTRVNGTIMILRQ